MVCLYLGYFLVTQAMMLDNGSDLTKTIYRKRKQENLYTIVLFWILLFVT